MIKQPNSRFCFLCGKQNPRSLKMEWFNHPDKGEIRGTVTVPDEYNGYPGVVHGGVVAAILDETAGRAILLGGDDEDLMVTMKLEVVYKKPTQTGVPLTAVGKVLRRTKTRALVEGELYHPDGTMTASCTAIVVKPPAEVEAAWEPERAYWRVYED